MIGETSIAGDAKGADNAASVSGATGSTGTTGSAVTAVAGGAQAQAPPLPASPAEAAAGPPWPVEHRYECDDSDPWFRFETRVPACGPPYPAWARDPLIPQLIDGARYLLLFIIDQIWGPASYALQGEIWQRKKFDVLDWLRPLELLLRRILLIEAFALLGAQSLPAARAGRARPPAGIARPARARPPFDPTRPDTWRVSFVALPGQGRSGPRHKLPPVQPDRLPYEKRLPNRYRRKLVNALPLARRLEAAIRVINDPQPYVRRLAFRLRRGRTVSAVRLVIPTTRRWKAARDDLAASGQRAAQLLDAYWGSG
jgi:hypothetical protein